MALEEKLRADLALVIRALGFVERIPHNPTEPLRDALTPDWPKFGPEAQAYQDFLMGNPKEGRPGAWDRLSPILSSFRIKENRPWVDELLHSTLVHPAGWLNTVGHADSWRQLLGLLDDRPTFGCG
jgi:hypothetical protein